MLTRQTLAQRIGAGWVLALACALLLAGTQGLVHQVVHAPLHDAASAHDLADEHAAHRHTGDDELPWLARLFAAHDDGDTVCRLFDQSGHPAVLPYLALPGLPLLASPKHIACHEAIAPAPPAALTQARGPPAFR